MANNYSLSSFLYPLKPEQVEEAKKIVATFGEAKEADPEQGYVGFDFSFEDDGLWVRHNESMRTDHAAELVSALQVGLQATELFSFDVAYICDKPRVDEFAGGCWSVSPFGIAIYVDPRQTAEQLVLDTMPQLPPTNKMKVDPWFVDNIQFPRLLAEINASISFNPKQIAELLGGMGLESWEPIRELFDRATRAWDNHKKTL